MYSQGHRDGLGFRSLGPLPLQILGPFLGAPRKVTTVCWFFKAVRGHIFLELPMYGNLSN